MFDRTSRSWFDHICFEMFSSKCSIRCVSHRRFDQKFVCMNDVFSYKTWWHVKQLSNSQLRLVLSNLLTDTSNCMLDFNFVCFCQICWQIQAIACWTSISSVSVKSVDRYKQLHVRFQFRLFLSDLLTNTSNCILDFNFVCFCQCERDISEVTNFCLTTAHETCDNERIKHLYSKVVVNVYFTLDSWICFFCNHLLIRLKNSRIINIIILIDDHVWCTIESRNEITRRTSFSLSEVF